jgi:hypothetical protein
MARQYPIAPESAKKNKQNATGEREKEESRKSEKGIRPAHLLNVAFTLTRQSG